MWYPHALMSTITLFATLIARWHSQPSAPSWVSASVILGGPPLIWANVHEYDLPLFVTVTVLPAQAFHLSAVVCRHALALSADGNATTAWVTQWAQLSPGAEDTSPLTPV